MNGAVVATDRIELSKFPMFLAKSEEISKPKVNMIDALAEFIFTTKYARYSEANQRRETWDETVSRVEGMHVKKFADRLDEEERREISWAFNMVRAKRDVPSMRSMQFGGKAVEAHNARMYNCAVRHLDCLRAFSELFYLLLCGCGVGVGLTRKYVNRIPNLIKPEDRTKQDFVFVIPDTIEGWADSAGVLLDSFFEGTSISGDNVIFDYSFIRPAGAELKTSGGVAPGPEGLMEALEEVRKLLNELVDQDFEKLRTIDAYDILMHLADAVLSGGVRRSATSVLFDKDDELMLNAKTGNWYETHPFRANSNISVLLIRSQVTKDEFVKIVENTKQWGEPGFVFAETEDVVYNPCFEVSFVPVTEDGRTGVQFCNLTSINGAKVKTEKDFYDASRAAALIGTLQATYTHFPYLSDVAKELTESEGLLGVSITAMMENPDILLVPEFQKKAAKFAVETNKRWAKKLGIKQAARVTVVKPEGTSTLALGSMASGIHPAHARKMFRRVTMNLLDPVYKHFQFYNPQMCEPSARKPKIDASITFPIDVSESAMIKSDLTALTHLDIILSTQLNWVLPGTTEANTRPVAHNVSCTVVVKDDEWQDVENYIFENRNHFTAVSLIGASGDKDYKQAPMEAVTTAEDEEKFERLKKNFCPVDYSLMIEKEDNTSLMKEMSCAGGACEIV